jgi:hypothetical protein
MVNLHGATVGDGVSKGRRRIREFWIAVPIVVLLGGGISTLAGYTLFPSMLALLLLALCAYPSVRYIVMERDNVVPAVPILAAAYAFQFAVPYFFGDGMVYLVGGYQEIDPQYQSTALLIANGAMLAFLAVTYSSAATAVSTALPVIRLQLNRTRALAFCIFFGGTVGIGSGAFAALSPDTLAQVAALIRVLQTQIFVAIGVLAWLSHTSRSVWMHLFYYGFVIVAVIGGISTGFVEAAIAPIAIVFTCEWIYKHRINKALVVCVFAAMLILNPVKGHYRDVVWYSAGPEAAGSRLDKTLLWLEAGIDFWADVIQGKMRAEDATAQLVRRASMVDILAHVYQSTPDPVPYFKGETYSYFTYSLIPRFLWPEKPVASANRVLAVTYGLTTEEGAERSTFGVSLVGEGYANFGWFGALGIMAVLGLILRLLQRMFTTPESGPGGYALFLAFFIFFLNGLGSSAEILLGNLMQSLIVSTLLMYWVSEKRHRG